MKSLPILLFFVSSCAAQQLLFGTAVPSEGGRALFTGVDLFSARTINKVSIGDNTDCADIVLISDTQLGCRLPPGTGRDHQIVLTADDREVITENAYQFRAPVVQVVNYESGQLTLQGRNFGSEASDITVDVFIRADDPDTVHRCENVALSTAHREITCDVTPAIPTGSPGAQFFVRVLVDELANNWKKQPTFSIGVCYSSALNTETVENILLGRSLKKNIDKLNNLSNDMARMKTNLPVYNENSCCGVNYVYPLSINDMANIGMWTIHFGDCLGDLCSQQDMLNELLTSE